MVTFGEIFSMPFMNSYWISRTQTTNRGQYAALYTMAWSAAQRIGPMRRCTISAAFMGSSALWWTVGGISILTSFAFWLLHRTGK